MSISAMKIDAIMQHLVAETEQEKADTLSIIRELLTVKSELSAPTDEVGTRIKNTLLQLGVPSHVSGYNHLVTAIAICASAPTAIDAMHKVLYPKVAKIHNTKANRVERTIRHAIELAWSRGDPDVLFKYFGNTISLTKGKTTNGEFISRIANVIREEV